MFVYSWRNLLASKRLSTTTRRQRRALRDRLSATRSLHLEPLESRRLLAFDTVASYPVGANPQAVAIGDFNSDSLVDLIAVNNSSNTVSVLLSNGDGTFAPAIDSPTNTADGAGQWPRSLAIGDFDGDLQADDVVTLNSGDVSILLGNGDGSMRLAGTVSLPDQDSPAGMLSQYPASVAVGDLTNDGKLDVTVMGHSSFTTKNGPYPRYDYYGQLYGYYYTYESHNRGHVNVLVGSGAGGFTPTASALQLEGIYPISEVLEKLDGAAGLDLAIADYYGARVQILSGNNDGTFDPPADSSTGWNPTSIASGDVNGDGISDLITSNYYSANVLLGNGSAGVGNGTFQLPKTTNFGSYPASVAVGDINDDGKIDLVTSSSFYTITGGDWYSGYTGYQTGQVSVLLGYGDGTFAGAASQNLEARTYAAGVAVGDLDGDGLPDVAVANALADAGQVSVLLNTGGWVLPARLSINDVSVTEGNSGTVAAVFTVTRSGNSAGALSVGYSTANGDALAGSDYVAKTATVSFADGATTASITIQVNGDVMDEFDQSFYVNLSPASGVIIVDGQGTGTILDNDAAPTLSITSRVSLKEGNNNARTTFIFVVTLSAISEKEVRVNFATADNTATVADGDYIATAGTLLFVPGQISKSISVTVKGDKRKEPTETFFVKLSGAVNATLPTGTQGIGEILGDDTSPGKGKP